MPQYVFKCPVCGEEETLTLAMAQRDECMIYCRHEDGGVHRKQRVATTAAFTIGGFNAANGYAKPKGQDT